jgi:hypothetical protein
VWISAILLHAPFGAFVPHSTLVSRLRVITIAPNVSVWQCPDGNPQTLARTPRPRTGTKPNRRTTERSQFVEQRNEAQSPYDGTKPIRRATEQSQSAARRNEANSSSAGTKPISKSGSKRSQFQPAWQNEATFMVLAGTKPIFASVPERHQSSGAFPLG